jgi:hypothetical protein
LHANLVHGTLCFALAATVVLVLRSRWRFAVLPALLLGLVELLWLAIPITPSSTPTPPPTPVHGFLCRERDREPTRAAGGFTVARVAVAAAFELPAALPPNLLVPHRIRDLNAIGVLDARSHLPLRALYGPEFLIKGFWPHAFPDDERLQHPLLDLYGVRYLLGHARQGEGPRHHGGKEALAPLVGPQGTFHVVERQNPCPRAFVVSHARFVRDDQEALAAMVDPEFDPRRVVLIADDAPVQSELAEGVTRADRVVRFVRDEPSRVTVHVASGAGGFLVLTDTFLPGWSACANETPVPIQRVDLCFRAVRVPAGEVTVDFRYDPPGLILGALVSALAVLVTGGLLASGIRRRAGNARRSTGHRSG